MRYLAFLVALAGLVSSGCGGGNQPAFGDLHPVSGTVSQGGQPVNGGVIRFHPEDDKGEFIINSEVGPDGKFTLSTVRATDRTGERKRGVAAGKYRVVYAPPIGNQPGGGPGNPIELPAALPISGPETDLKVDLPAARK